MAPLTPPPTPAGAIAGPPVGGAVGVQRPAQCHTLWPSTALRLRPPTGAGRAPVDVSAPCGGRAPHGAAPPLFGDPLGTHTLPMATHGALVAVPRSPHERTTPSGFRQPAERAAMP